MKSAATTRTSIAAMLMTMINQNISGLIFNNLLDVQEDVGLTDAEKADFIDLRKEIRKLRGNLQAEVLDKTKT